MLSTLNSATNSRKIMTTNMLTNWKILRESEDPKMRFLYWLKCREAARIGKMLYDKPPYTCDEIIGKYKFCNVNREHDAVTIWVKDNIRDNPRLIAERTPHLMVMNLAIARLFNHPATLEEIGFPLMSVDRLQTACDVAAARKDRGEKMLRGAYLVTPHGGKNKGVKTSDYVVRIVGYLCESIAPFKHFLGLSGIAEEMLKAYGWQAFMVNQICTDLRYTPWFKDAPDWETFVMAGPGTRRGINRSNGCIERTDV